MGAGVGGWYRIDRGRGPQLVCRQPWRPQGTVMSQAFPPSSHFLPPLAFLPTLADIHLPSHQDGTLPGRAEEKGRAGLSTCPDSLTSTAP